VDNPLNLGRPLSPEEIAASLTAEIQQRDKLIESQQKDLDALKAEFSKASTAQEAVETARKKIEDLLPLALVNMENLLTTAESESVRSSLSRFVVTSVLDKKLEDKDDNEIKALLTALQGNNTEVPTE